MNTTRFLHGKRIAHQEAPCPEPKWFFFVVMAQASPPGPMRHRAPGVWGSSPCPSAAGSPLSQLVMRESSKTLAPTVCTPGGEPREGVPVPLPVEVVAVPRAPLGPPCPRRLSPVPEPGLQAEHPGRLRSEQKKPQSCPRGPCHGARPPAGGPIYTTNQCRGLAVPSGLMGNSQKWLTSDGRSQVRS